MLSARSTRLKTIRYRPVEYAAEYFTANVLMSFSVLIGVCILYHIFSN